MDRARKAAVQAVMRLHGGSYTAEAADAALSQPGLSPQDRAFAAALFFATAEHLATLDWLLAPLCSRGLEKLDVEVRAILETGLCQMRYMRVPARAAVNEAVALARAFRKTSAGGFINAVLRRAASAELEAGAFSCEEERVAAVYSLSRPVAAAILRALPGDYEAYLGASWSNGETALRVNSLRTGEAELASSLEAGGCAVRPGPLAGCLWARLPGGVAGQPQFQAGLYHVQDPASQAACACLGAAPGKKLLDLCAAPGGKSATLAQQMGGGAGLTVCDVNPARLEKARGLFARLGIEGAEFLENDGRVYREALAGQDAVLCDVPCSGLGVLAAKPDLRYGSGENYAALPALQLKILETAARYVKQGGRLVYSTCTIRAEENQSVVKAFLAKAPHFALAPPLLSLENAIIKEKMMTFLPQNTQTAGFFVASMERL